MSKKKWEVFEEECRNWLVDKFGDLAEFTLMGGFDSSVSDIKVRCPNDAVFFIEVKAPSSQCSQFVLLPDDANREFVYSLRNKLEMNPFTQHLIDYMNANYTSFRNPGTKGIAIDPKESEAAGHIRYQHMVKGVEFFLSRNNLGFILIPLSFIGFYFDIEAVYRKKKSGSRDIPNKDMESINEWLKDNMNITCVKKGDEFVTYRIEDLVGKPFEIDDNRYMFSERREEYMRLRSLSSTENPNVIFTINLKDDVTGLPDEFFRSFLKLVSRG